MSYWKFPFSMGLGMFIFFGHSNKDEEYQAQVLVHEYGHTIQSCMLGPLFMFVIAIPSVVWAFTPVFEKMRKEGKYDYLEFYPEAWANYEGERILKMPAPSKRLADQTLSLTVLVDNKDGNDVKGEWGLSFYLEHQGKKYLLDAGQTGLFVDNAKALGLSIEDIDYAILSHAHYDHSNGFKTFFNANTKAKLYLNSNCAENCYDKKEAGIEYIGINKGLLENNKDRLYFVDGDYTISKGVYLIPHKINLVGKTATMCKLINDEYIEENFNHEQSLVFETNKGLVILNSCCHGGVVNIINETKQTFPDKKIYAIVGGFHLFKSSEEEINAFAEALKKTEIELIVTGHCTGDAANTILQNQFGDKVKIMYSGLKLVI